MFLIPARYLFYHDGILLKLFSALVLFTLVSARLALFASGRKKENDFLRRANAYLFYNFVFQLFFAVLLALPFAHFKPYTAILYVATCFLLFFLPVSQLCGIFYFWKLTKPSFSIFFGFLKSGVFLWAALSLAFLCAGVDAFLIEPYWLKVRHVTISSHKITKPRTILHLSDIQMDNFGVREKKLARIVKNLSYDAVVITGDFINYDFTFEDCRRLLSELDFKKNVFVVSGDTDVMHSANIQSPERMKTYFEKLFKKNARNVTLMDNQALKLFYVKGVPFIIGGVPRFHEENVQGLWKEVSREKMKENFVLLLSHSPDVILYEDARKADLVLAGHTHGGQVRIPFIGALVTNTKLGRHFASGLFRFGKTRLFISRGVGLEGLATPKIRFFCRPEIVLITIKPAKKS